jgi:hypothetical protein
MTIPRKIRKQRPSEWEDMEQYMHDSKKTDSQAGSAAARDR